MKGCNSMKRLVLKNMVFGFSIMFLFTACETGYKGEFPTKDTSEVNSSSGYNFEYKEVASEPQEFEGGHLSDGLNITKIRQSKHGNMLRLVFDSEGENNGRVGSYSFVYYPEKYLITAIVGGYRSFSAQLPSFSNDSIIEKIYMDEYLDDSGYKFHIKLREDVKVKVFDLQNPARIVVDVGGE